MASAVVPPERPGRKPQGTFATSLLPAVSM